MGSGNRRPFQQAVKQGFKKIDPEKLRTYVEEHPDDTQQEITDEFHCSNQAVRKALKHLNITSKKTRRYKEQDETYEEMLEPFSEEKRVYVDESGFNACYDREYGYAPRGAKVFGEVSGMKFSIGKSSKRSCGINDIRFYHQEGELRQFPETFRWKWG